jgi:hypothetical protein
VRERWPYWNRSLSRARAGSPRHVLSLLGERGAGDAFAAAAPRLHYEIADEIAPSSLRRAWFSLTLNGMADTRLT